MSLADLIVLGGSAGVEEAARKGGHEIEVPFMPGRTDASAEQTDAELFEVLEPVTDAFRNYQKQRYSITSEQLMVDKAHQLCLAAPELAVLLGGMRVIGTNADGSSHGVLTDRPGALSNDFYVNLLDMGTIWKPTSQAEEEFEGRDRVTGDLRWTGTRVDLIFGSHSQLRAIAEVYGQQDAKETFVKDFVTAWTKVMENDRFDLHGQRLNAA